jgi:hypothetical protein
VKKKELPPGGNLIRFNKHAGDKPTAKQVELMFAQIHSLIRAGDYKALRALVALTDYLANTDPPEAS